MFTNLFKQTHIYRRFGESTDYRFIIKKKHIFTDLRHSYMLIGGSAHLQNSLKEHILTDLPSTYSMYICLWGYVHVYKI